MKKPELKQRAWVRKHRNNLPQLHVQVSRRILVLRDKLWRGDLKPFVFILEGVLGLKPPTVALFNAMVACWELDTPKLCYGNYLNLLAVASAFSYFNRRNKSGFNVLAYAPLNGVPSDHIHLLDFTPVELGRHLDAAILAHGLGREFTLICNWLKATSFKPEPLTINPSYMYKAQSRRNDFLENLYALNGSKVIANKSALKLHLMANHNFTPDSEAFTERLSREFAQVRAARLPLARKYDAARFESLKAGVGVPWAASGNTLAQLFLKWTQGDNSVFGLSVLQELLEQEAQPAPEKGTPDEIYIVVKQVAARRELVQDVREQEKSNVAALVECRKKYPGMTLKQLESDCDGSNQHLEAALDEASEKLHRGPEFARKLYKRASANAAINMVWSEYLRRFASF